MVDDAGDLLPMLRNSLKVKRADPSDPMPLQCTARAMGAIYASRTDRLGSRLLAIANALRLKEKFSVPLRIHWPEVDTIAQGLNDPYRFFDPGFIAAHRIGDKEWAIARETTTSFSSMAAFTSDRAAKYLADGGSIDIGLPFGMRGFADEDPDELAMAGQRIWSGFPLAPHLLSVRARLARQIGSECTAVHLRRGDIVNDPKTFARGWFWKFAPDAFYHAQIARALACGRTVIIFSDDPVAANRFQAAHPGALLAVELIDRVESSGGPDVAELIAMSLCDRIVAPAQSAFSVAAAVFGGGRLADVMTDLPAEDRLAAFGRLRAELEEVGSDVALNSPELALSVPSLLHMMQNEGQGSDALSLLGKLIDKGLTAPFLETQFAVLMINQGCPEAVLARAEVLARISNNAQLAFGSALRALASALTGREAASLAAAAFWQDPAGPEVAQIIGALMAAGKLGSHNFLPMEGALETIGRLETAADIPGLSALGLCPGQILPSATALLWDWAPFFRTASRRELQSGARIRSLGPADIYEMGRATSSPDILSLVAIARAYEGDIDTAYRALARLADADTGAMVLHRLSLVAEMAKRSKVAAQAAKAAMEAAPDIPAHRAWWARHALRNGQSGVAFTDLEAATSAGLAFPHLLLLQAAAAQQIGNLDAERAALDLACSQAPRSARVLVARAEHLVRGGDLDGARATCQQLLTLAGNAPAARRLAAVLGLKTAS